MHVIVSRPPIIFLITFAAKEQVYRKWKPAPYWSIWGKYRVEFSKIVVKEWRQVRYYGTDKNHEKSSGNPAYRLILELKDLTLSLHVQKKRVGENKEVNKISLKCKRKLSCVRGHVVVASWVRLRDQGARPGIKRISQSRIFMSHLVPEIFSFPSKSHLEYPLFRSYL